MTIDISAYDFVDFGCSKGDSMKFVAAKYAKTNGIGIDIEPTKVEETRALGYHAEIADLTKPGNFSGQVPFSIVSHILEHIPTVRMAADILHTSALISSDFVLVRQPWFDADGALAEMGLKFYWSDWSGHTNHMTTLQMYIILKTLLDQSLISSFSIWGNTPINSTADSRIIPIDGGRDRHRYDPASDNEKPDSPISVPCYAEIVAYLGVDSKIDTSIAPKGIMNAELLFHKVDAK